MDGKKDIKNKPVHGGREKGWDETKGRGRKYRRREEKTQRGTEGLEKEKTKEREREER